jgi:FtsZ-binding cell division protein ZapB
MFPTVSSILYLSHVRLLNQSADMPVTWGMLQNEVSNLREEIASVRGDVANIRDDVANIRGDVAALRNQLSTEWRILNEKLAPLLGNN